jgi:hypothetical protein
VRIDRREREGDVTVDSDGHRARRLTATNALIDIYSTSGA